MPDKHLRFPKKLVERQKLRDIQSDKKDAVAHLLILADTSGAAENTGKQLDRNVEPAQHRDRHVAAVFGKALDIARHVIARNHIDVAYSMEWNTWQGRTTLQMVVADIKPAGG